VKHFQVDLELKGSYMTPFRADTLFGGICWSIRYAFGENVLTDFLDLYRQSDPPVLLSNGFPAGLLPRPYVPVTWGDTLDGESMLAKTDAAKRASKSRYVTLDGFVSFCSTGIPDIKMVKPELQRVVWRNQTDRLSGTTAERGGLFTETEFYLREEFPGLTMYVWSDEQWVDLLQEALAALGQTGLGKRRSVGRGAFAVVGWRETEPLGATDGANAFITLSDFVPASNDPVEGWWTIEVKLGKLSEEYALQGSPLKRPLLVIGAGSVFRTHQPPKIYYGRMVEGLSPRIPQVLHYGLSFAVPMRLPDR